MQVDTYQLAATMRRFQERAPERQRNLYRISRGESLSVDTPERVRMFLQRRGIPEREIDRMMAGEARPNEVAITESAGVREPDGLERVLGTNDLMGVAFLQRGLDVARTVARIWVDTTAGAAAGYGTGFLISPRLLMTNNHVLGDAAAARASKAQFSYELDINGNAAPASLHGLDPDTFFLTNRELDYAVVAVAPNGDGPRSLPDYGFNSMIEEVGKAIVAQWLNIIQHPNGGYKQLALRENHLVDIDNNFLTYQTDTAPGSSGSPIFNDRWEVVGLHHSGVMARDAQRRILATDGRVWTPDMGEDKVKWISNEGIRISSIIRDLRAKATSTAQKRLIDEMLAAAAGGTASAGRDISRGSDGRRPGPASSESISAPVVADDGSATWTIPLSITVRLPGQHAGALPPPRAAPGPAPSADLPRPGVAGDVAQILREAKATLGARPDVLEVRQGYVFENGWITKKPAIVVKVRKRQSPAALREASIMPLPLSVHGLPIEVVNPTIDDLIAAHRGTTPERILVTELLTGEEIVYRPPPSVELRTITARMKITACVSPDQGWTVLDQFLRATQRRLVVGMYDFGATHIASAIEAAGAAAGFEQMILAIQAGSSEGRGTKANDLSDEKMVERLAGNLGRKFEAAWVKIGIRNGWVATSYHIKVAVRDHMAIWLSSGNWQSSNQPDGDPLHENPQRRSWLSDYNREWHVVAENDKLAEIFEAYLLNDFEQNVRLGGQEEVVVPDLLLPSAVLVEAAEERAAPFEYFGPFKDDREFTVRPLLTPDNYKEVLLDVVRRAGRELLIQNQTFNAAKADQEDLGELLDAIVQRQNAGVEVRIIFRILDSSKARENLEALQDRGFDMRQVKVQRNCHTKGIIADRTRLIVGSQNLSQLGITLNRDASLYFEDDPELAGYFRKIFEHDWANLARQRIGSEAHAPELVLAGQATPEGMERISWKEYIEMA